MYISLYNNNIMSDLQRCVCAEEFLLHSRTVLVSQFTRRRRLIKKEKKNGVSERAARAVGVVNDVVA